MTTYRLTVAIGTLALASSLALTGCASTPEPVAEMASARTAIRAIQGSDAQMLAPVQLDRAKTKLQRAEAAIVAEEYEEATRLANESLADAELAAAQANAIKAQRNADELQRSIDVLRSELDRAQSF